MAYAPDQREGKTERVMKQFKEVAFIDSGVEAPNELATMLKDGIAPIMLSPNTPALEQIADHLKHHADVSMLHVFSHGSSGKIEFTAGHVDSLDLDDHQDTLQRIGSSLRDDATINLWVCEVAQGNKGETFVLDFAELTGRSVAASSRKVGATEKGGSWSLDRFANFSAAAQPLKADTAYAGVFANVNATTATDTATQTTANDTLTITDTTQLQSTDNWDGAAGIDGIQVGTATGVAINLTAASLTTTFKNYEQIIFTNTSGTTTLTMNGNQFGATLGLMPLATQFVGNTGTQLIVINNATNFTAASWVFTNWTIGTDNVSINGSTGNDSITGSAQNDTINGGAGTNALAGGLGDDTYIINSATDVVTENAASGTDNAQSSVSYTLTANVENLTLTGTGALTGIGNALNNVLTGNTGNNYLDGAAGVDTLIGGLGDDTYVVDSTTDTLTENAGEGTDTIQSSVNFTIGTNFENLTLTGTAAINGTGNAANNAIYGNNFNNILDGGAGIDTLAGAGGDDTYIVDSTTDTLTEVANNGIDTVQSSVTFTLAANFENLVLTGSSNINATGNADANSITGNSGDNVIDGGIGADTMAGGAGNDTYYVDNAGDIITEGVSAGTDTVQTALAHTLAANVENLIITGASAVNGTGNSGNNSITGNSAVNTLTGGAGNDILDGGAGADTLIGGTGDDTYYVDDAGDIVTELVGEGSDTLVVAGTTAGVTFTVGNNIENITLSGALAINLTGNADNNTLVGNSAANTLTGGAGNDWLDGGTGADTMIGGLGDDTYTVDNAGDIVTENVGEGIDTLRTTFTVAALSAAFENLTLIGSGNINGTGNGLANIITGNNSQNTLDGGAGADTLAGGGGNDIYIIDATDTVTEGANAGIDTVQAAFTYVLGANLENLTLTGTAAINGTGNSLANSLIGTTGVNTLDGGAGADTMAGGAGNDIYVVDDAGDTVVENSGAGTDLVQSSVSHTLASNVENLILTGAGNIDGTGSVFNNVITGNSGNNVLDGGAGLDTMAGGAGNDTYVVDVSSDVIIENAAQGTDTVQSYVNYTLAANLENLVLVGGGTINGTGNADANTITGNDTDNVLDGAAGVDTLIGGLGDDTYVVDNTSDAIVELVDEGFDTVTTSMNFTLSNNLENLKLAGTSAISGTGNAVDNVITGNTGANTLYGLGGNDTLDGGTGADILVGGLGDDIFVVDNIGDSLFENAGEGTDTVKSSISLTIAGNFENLTLLGSAKINATGNSLDNILTGNSGTNILTGLAGNDTLDGGIGSDVMIGGDGDDTYYVDNLLDKVVELGGQGTDTVFSMVAYKLSDDIENLTLYGNRSVNATGNAMDNIITGNNGANILDGGIGADTLIGGLGNDTYVVDNALDVITEFENEGIDTVKTAETFTLFAAVENLTLTGTAAIDGTGNDNDNTILGNAASNILIGLIGNDILNGGLGTDTMIGGIGDDVYFVDNTADSVTELALEGTDTVNSTVAYTLGANLENLNLLGAASVNASGNSLDNKINGNSGVNIINGYDGDDTIDGGRGADKLYGGNGDDTYFLDTIGDQVFENAGAGTDTVKSKISYTLGANIENLTLAGSGILAGTGNGLNNVIIGNSSANVLRGFDGNDTLDGGLGADTLVGGNGDDIYYVDSVSDVVTELAGQGTDKVFSTVTYTLGANVENLQLTSSLVINGTGNTLNNTITGNVAANVLKGMDGDDIIDGGRGVDTMVGGNGNDTYYVDESTDIVTELSAQGTDTVYADTDYTLSANVENLTIVNATGWDATGNSLANTITGNSADNILDGAAGADSLIGGDGDDTYVIDDLGDSVTELVNQGIDTVKSSVSYTLGSDVEYLTLTGTAANNGTGNALGNLISGNAANNTLVGLAGDDELDGGVGADILKGGLGTDYLTGGDGNDVFMFESSTDSSLLLDAFSNIYGTDVINDFLTGDIINLAGVDANTTLAGDQAFAIDTVYGAGKMVFDTTIPNVVTINCYTDADAIADMTIIVNLQTPLTALVASDFIL
jgi:Ca2+-binding RTX toxin-like protein